MNADRRKQLSYALDQVNSALNIVLNSSEQEQEYVDSMPENLQESHKCRTGNEVAEELNEISTELEDISGRIEAVI